MKKVLKFTIAFLAGLLLFCFVLTKVGWQRLIEAGILFLSWQGLTLVALTFLMGVVGIIRWQMVFKSQGKKFSFSEIGRLWSIGYAVTYLTPMAFLGGEPLRAYLAHRKLRLGWKESIASVAIDKLLDATLFLSATIGGILLFLLYSPIPHEAMLWIAIGIVGLLGGGLFLFYFKVLQEESVLSLVLKWAGLEERLASTKNGKTVFLIDREVIRFFSFKHKYFWQGLGLSFLRYCLLVFKACFLLYFLEKIIAPAKGLAVYAFNNLAILLPFPAGLGSMEALEGLAFKSLGLSFASGTVFSMIYRAADIVLVVVGLMFLAKFGLDLLQNKILDSIGGKKP